DTDAGEVGCEIEGFPSVHQRGDVHVVQLEHIGEGIVRRRREQEAAILRLRERDVVLHHLQPRVPGAIRCEQQVFEPCGSVVGPVEELDPRARGGAAPPAGKRARERASQHAAHGSRAPAASNRCSCRRSSFTPTRSPGRRSGMPCTRATSGSPPPSNRTSVSGPSGSTPRTSAAPMPGPVAEAHGPAGAAQPVPGRKAWVAGATATLLTKSPVARTAERAQAPAAGPPRTRAATAGGRAACRAPAGLRPAAPAGRFRRTA